MTNNQPTNQFNSSNRSRRPSRGPRPGSTAPKRELKEKTLDLRRVTRVVKGGKRFSFRCTLIVGNERGLVGVGIAKGSDVAQAIDKARHDAQKHTFTVPLRQTTIAHETQAKFSAARVLIKPAKKGSGLKAGGAVRSVLLMAGISDASAKCLGRTKNKLTNALATLEALKQLKS
ncbi:MAG: 30S ribosomal protein S5 [Patescibacteria group bacterium]|nr:30S ribosomal protein S5 [Patescibacteria group bacterium]